MLLSVSLRILLMKAEVVSFRVLHISLPADSWDCMPWRSYLPTVLHHLFEDVVEVLDIEGAEKTVTPF
jgi:hypothetical protein